MAYGIEYLQRELGQSLYRQGLELAENDRVFNVRELSGGGIVTGLVARSDDPGCRTAANAYRVYIQLTAQGIDGECNCGESGNCAHTAAVLIANTLAPTAAPAPPGPARPRRRDSAATAEHRQPRDTPAGAQQLVYLIRPVRQPDSSFPQARRLEISLWVGPASATTAAGKAPQYHPFIVRNLNHSDFPRYVTDWDRGLIEALLARNSSGPWQLDRSEDADLIRRCISAGRLHWGSTAGPVLRWHRERAATLRWQLLDSAEQQLICDNIATAVIGIELEPPLYFNGQSGEAGRLNFSCDPARIRELWRQPPLSAEQAVHTNSRLRADKSLPLLQELAIKTATTVNLKAELYLSQAAGTTFAAVRFNYGGRAVNNRALPPQQHHIRRVAGSTCWVMARDQRREQQLLAQFCEALETAAGTEMHGTSTDGSLPEPGYTLPGSRAWLSFVLQVVPDLQRQGWTIETDPTFPYRLATAHSWYAQLHADHRPKAAHSGDWFNLELGVTIDGKAINLLPALVAYLQSDQSSTGAGDPIADHLPLAVGDGRYTAIPLQRVQSIVQTLVELFEHDSLNSEHSLTLPRNHLSRLAQLERELSHSGDDGSGASTLNWSGEEALVALAEKFRDFEGIAPQQTPQGFPAALRCYQLEGLGRLQFWREYALGGILADDMGLGKTVQALAHLAAEKNAGRLCKPSLIVAPTSVIGNWQREAQRFTPDFEIVVLHGSRRKSRFAAAATADLVITSYPLLNFDSDYLQQQRFYLLVLDEAQIIKNPRARVSQLARTLQAEHRLCLTGTPVENHLGELWSLFDFLQPGFLGSEKDFQRQYRHPIEKRADEQRSLALTRRIAPFILRRTKEAVASELPAKTEIVERVLLEPAQRDFYDGIRLTMHRRIRQIIQQQGLAGSQIAMLDALLKLRQACCDPRLVKLERQVAAVPSAKFERLMSMLPELVEEGRRVLLFSQFTAMLALIEQAVAARDIPYVKLTGACRDRDAAVEQFQTGATPLFLISLKAGGTGLNLTAADTVIHYDPWWNPAVENQATDRAYRIGQDKPVFVYKLIAENTVEEKILQLQQNKHLLASNLYQSSGGLSAQDLQALFEA